MSEAEGDPGPLGRAVDEVARELALARLEDARSALARAEAETDPDGLHDFRVALRRLRSLLEVFGEAFEPELRRRALERLRRIGGATGAARDAEVQLAWVKQHLSGGARSLRAAARELRAALDARRSFGAARARRQAAPEFFALWNELCGAWIASRAGDPPAPARAPERFGRVSGRVLADSAQRLEEELARVHSLADEGAAHEARIAAKRLRYTLDPLRGALPGAERAAAALRGLQDVLGELNDLRLLRVLVRTTLESAALVRAQARIAAAELEAWQSAAGAAAQRAAGAPAQRALFPAAEPAAEGAAASAPPGGASAEGLREAERRSAGVETGCVAAAHALERRRGELFAALERGWLGGAAEPFLAQLHALVRALLELGEGHDEIERKYLLTALPALPGGAETLEIEQGYLGQGDVRERVRRVQDASAQERFYRTLKLGRGVRRMELEQPIAREEFEQLWPRTAGSRIRKRRHRVPGAAGTWEIDEFSDRPLVLAEIELECATSSPAIPDWLAPVLVREVTDERAYTNQSLSRHAGVP